MSSASSTAFFMDSTVLSIISTPSLVFSPTMAHILVVPISRPTMMLSFFAIAFTAFLYHVGCKPYDYLAVVVEVERLYPFQDPVPGPEYLLKRGELLLERAHAHIQPHALVESKQAQAVVRVYFYFRYICYVKSAP